MRKTAQINKMTDATIISTMQGLLRGQHERTRNGCTFTTFAGIPYAKPPIGELRFKSPQPYGKWQGVRDAVKEGDVCYAFDPLLRALAGSEDCLVLNVYTPELPSAKSKAKPVMVYIHGGGFAFGSGSRDMCGPEFLIEKGIVLVTINYRVGTLGFLYLEDKSLGVHGNAGLKDQVMALRWVQENIAAFGGDPKNVTIFGESAGAASVHLQVLSPLSRGLFHQAITQSGAALAIWCKGDKNYSSTLLKKLGKSSKSDAETLHILQNITKEELLKTQNSIPLFAGYSQFGPVIEGYHEYQPFLPDEPMKLLKTGNYNKVPMIMGFNTAEGTFMKLLEVDGEISYDKLNSVATWNYEMHPGTPKFTEIMRRVKEFYFDNKEPSAETKMKQYRLISDLFFIRPTIESLEIMAAQGAKHPLYAYKFSRRTNLNQIAQMVGLAKEEGACHVDDLLYLFYSKMTPKIEGGSVEERSIDIMTTWWTNFAKYGNPNGRKGDTTKLGIEWPMLGRELNFLHIDDDISVIQKADESYMKFWRDMDKYVNSE